MVERVRLLVWDLDETFWGGTLTEGGISFSDENKRIVIELAKRGIVSSICSKNDFAAVRDILVAHDIWDYFVLPSISWDPKGPRIAALIDTFGLRPPTVMFVDDNPLNLAEARNCVPDIQTKPHTFIAEILDSPLFQGKDDRDLTRLKQYKVLEQRRNEAEAAPDIHQFLRDSNIRVRLEFDLKAHMPRVVELINRTNQLNFTKRRLSEGITPEEAFRALALDNYYHHGALIHVADRYGDHGFCGFFLCNTETRRLVLYCFSCRILGMGVEAWLYDKLGRPQIDIVGEVLTDLHAPRAPVDWINVDIPQAADAGERKLPGRVIARGACALGALIHYFAATFPQAVGEYHVFRCGTAIRIDHTEILRQTIEGISPQALVVARRLGFEDGDFTTALFDDAPDGQVVLLSFATDTCAGLFRHRETGLVVPVEIPDSARDTEWGRETAAYLEREFDVIGQISEAQFKANFELMLRRLASLSRIFVLMQPLPESEDVVYDRFSTIERSIEEIAANDGRIELVRIADYLVRPEDMRDLLHYDRAVYFAIYEDIVGAI